MEGSGATELRMVQFKYGAGVPVVWSVWCNDHRAQLQFRLNLKLPKKLRQLKVRSGEHCNPTTWSGHSHNALGCWRTYAFDSGTSPELGQEIGFPTKTGRNDVIIICTHSIACGSLDDQHSMWQDVGVGR